MVRAKTVNETPSCLAFKTAKCSDLPKLASSWVRYTLQHLRIQFQCICQPCARRMMSGVCNRFRSGKSRYGPRECHWKRDSFIQGQKPTWELEATLAKMHPLGFYSAEEFRQVWKAGQEWPFRDGRDICQQRYNNLLELSVQLVDIIITRWLKKRPNLTSWISLGKKIIIRRNTTWKLNLDRINCIPRGCLRCVAFHAFLLVKDLGQIQKSFAC